MKKNRKVKEIASASSFSMHSFLALIHNTIEVIKMDKSKQEKQVQKNSNETFNNITEKVRLENQNQTHNSRREGMGPNTKRKPS